MGTVVTIEALLAEVAALRAELAATRAELVRVTAENVALRAENAELSARLGQDSSNSSRPPSSDRRWKLPRRPPNPPTGRKPGGQPGHEPHRREMLPPTAEFDVPAPECRHCGANLPPEIVVGEAEHVHQVVDIEIRPVVHDYHLLVHKCPRCKRRTGKGAPRESLERELLRPRQDHRQLDRGSRRPSACCRATSA